nr:hypothetical protein [Streptococcus sp. 11-4097]
SDRYLQTTSGAFVMGENNERIRIPEGAKVAVQADGTLYDAVTQNNIARLQTKTVDAEANARLMQRENKSFALAEGNIADLPNGTGTVKNHMLENSNVDMTKEMAD